MELNLSMCIQFVVFFSVFFILYTSKSKTLKKCVIIAVVLFIVGLAIHRIHGYGPKIETLPFRQPSENIISVEIQFREFNAKAPDTLTELSGEEAKELITMLKSLELDHSSFNTRLSLIGTYVKVEYKNGEVEWLTYYNNFWQEAGDIRRFGKYGFKDVEQYDAILKQYCQDVKH